MGKLICPNCKSSTIRKNKYSSDNIFGLDRSNWYDQTGRWVCENCGTFIKTSGKTKTESEAPIKNFPETMKKRTEVFIEKFQRFEKLLKQAARSSDEDHFPSVLKKIADQNIFINKNYSLALDLNSLRNVFAHQKRGEYIANINNRALKKLDRLIEVLKNPPTVISEFKVKVYEAKTIDLISSVMAKMREKIYTHVPIWEDDKFVGVFSYTSFFEWLADRQSKSRSNERISFTKKFISHINRKYLNSPSVNFRFISETTNLYEIPTIFEKATLKRERLDCLLITPNGRKGKKLTGIITSWDLGLIKSKMA